ncbi:MAG: hypothetical protein JST60_04195 [Chloroflexi bacterium SZAS-1]|nr:hypothetical protein [Chloroflexi bacterium SZAS-1]
MQPSRITQGRVNWQRLLRRVLPLEVLIFGGVGALCWLFGWRSLYDYGSALLLAGVIIFGFGSFGGVGGRRMPSHPHRVRQGLVLMAWAAIITLPPIIVGIMLQIANAP